MKAHNVERLTAMRRVEEQRVSDLRNYAKQSHWLGTCAEKENRADEIRKANLKAREEAEKEQRRLLMKKQETRQRDLASKEMERRMVMEMHKQKTEREAREAEMQRIIETSDELKELEHKIKTAYVNKERAAQHQESPRLYSFIV